MLGGIEGGGLMLELTITGLDELRRKFGEGFRKPLRALVHGVAEELRGAIAEYPGPVVYPVRWASDAQRRAYFAKRKGLGPYVRQFDPFSERLGPSWATEMRGDFEAVVGTRVSYAPWVQAAGHQQPMHADTGWKTDEQAVEEVERSGAIERIFEQAMEGW